MNKTKVQQRSKSVRPDDDDFAFLHSSEDEDNVQFEEDELTASICSDSFFEFVKEFWDVTSSEAPVWNWHISYLCGELQRIAERVFAGLPCEYDLIVNIAPGTTKSTIFSVMFPAWVWTRRPDMQIIVGSYSYDLGLDLSRKCRDIIRSEKYRKFYPQIQIREDQDTKQYFINTKGGKRYTATVGGSVMGMHGHFVLVDDPLDPQSALSDAEVKIANHWMSETLPGRKVNQVVDPTIIIHQRVHEDDPTGHRKSKKGARAVKHICLPAELTEHVAPHYLRKYYVDSLFDPVRLPRSVLNEKLAELLDYGYASQYLQNPIPRGGGMIKADRLIFEPRPPVKLKRLVRYWDKAGTRGGGAFTVGLKMGVDQEGFFWIVDVIRGQWDSSTRENIILQTAKADGKNVVVGVEQEPGSGGKESAEATVRRLAGFRTRVYKPTRGEDKAIRADPLSVQVNSGNVRVVTATWNAALVNEMRFFPYSKYKDQVDAASGAFSILTSKIIRVGSL